MNAIRIIATPPGHFPERFREQWVGIELPLATPHELAKNASPELGTDVNGADGHFVSAQKALYALRKARRGKAADFWKCRVREEFLFFPKELCEMVI